MAVEVEGRGGGRGLKMLLSADRRRRGQQVPLGGWWGEEARDTPHLRGLHKSIWEECRPLTCLRNPDPQSYNRTNLCTCDQKFVSSPIATPW